MPSSLPVHPIEDAQERDTSAAPFGAAMWPLAVFVALAIFLTWPIARDPGRLMTAPAFGDPALNAWILAWGADRALHGFAGFWTGLFFYPVPDAVAYSEHLLGITIFTAPVQWLSANPVLAYNVALVGATFLAGWGMFVLARELTGRHDAALVAGVAFAALPYRVPASSHLQVLMTGWMPLALWGLHRYLATGRRRSLALFATAFVLQAWSNGYFLYFLSLPVSIIAVHALWTGSAARRRRVRHLALAAAGILLAIAPVAAAYVRVRRNTGLARSLQEITQYSAPLEAYLHVSDRMWLWGAILPHGRHELELFTGLTIVLLATASLSLGWRTHYTTREPASAHRQHTLVRLYGVILLAALLLSLGPRPSLLGWRLPFTGPYGWLLSVLPGLDGLRVPARLAMVVFLTLAVLAALGLASLTSRWSRRRRAMAAAVCAIAIAGEGYGGAVPTARFPTRDMGADLPAYEWLAGQPPGAVLELPVGGAGLATRYMYRTLLHRHRIVNGYSGSGSAMQDLMGGPAFTELAHAGEALRAARAVGVQYLVVHPSLYGDARQGDALVQALRNEPEHVQHVTTLGAASIATLRPLTVRPAAVDPAWVRIPRTAFSVSASHNVQRLEQAFDGNTQSRWLTGERQQGREWIEMHFTRPQDVARIRIDVDRRSRTDYPRGLVVETSPDGLTFTSFPVHAFERLARSLIDDPAHAGIDVLLPPNRTRIVRLRVTGDTRLWFWSVDELRLYAR